MNLETIQSMWETDSQIDQFKIHDEAAKIPMLHAKYWDVYNALKLLKEKAIAQESKVKLDRHNYYTGKSDPPRKGCLFLSKYKHVLRNVMDDDRDLLAELQEAIAQGPIIFTPDEEFLEKLNDKKED